MDANAATAALALPGGEHGASLSGEKAALPTV
jgi:hypothetical protein